MEALIIIFKAFAASKIRTPYPTFTGLNLGWEVRADYQP